MNLGIDIHNVVIRYQAQTNRIADDRKRNFFIPTIRAVGLIGFESIAVVVNITQLAVEILFKLSIPLLRVLPTLLKKCCRSIKPWDDSLNRVNEAMHPGETLTRTILLLAALTGSCAIGIICPCVNSLWHETLGLTSARGTQHATETLPKLNQPPPKLNS